MPNRVEITSKVTVNLDRVFKAVMDDSFKTQIVNEFYTLADPYVPMDTGDLATTTNITPEFVEYSVPYAHYQWEGKNLRSGGELNYNKEKHAKATSHWDKVFMDMEGDKFIKYVRDEAKKRLKGG